MEWIAKILEAVKLPTSIIFIGLIVCASILLLPDSYLNSLMILEIKQDHGMYVGMAGLISFAVLVARVFKIGWGNWKTYRKLVEMQKKAELRISQLDSAEQAVLREFFFIQQQNTVKLPIDDPVVAGLIQSGVLQQVGQLGRHIAGNIMCNVRIASNLLLTNQMLGVADDLGGSDFQWIMNNRPRFMRRIERYGRLA